MIRNAVAGQPQAAYLLVQQTLMQQASLQQAQARIADLEQRVRRPPAASADGSFLGGAGRGGWSSPPASPAAGSPGTAWAGTPDTQAAQLGSHRNGGKPERNALGHVQGKDGRQAAAAGSQQIRKSHRDSPGPLAPDRII